MGRHFHSGLRRLTKTDMRVNYERLNSLSRQSSKPHYLLLQGDCRKVLFYIKSESIQLIFTSPPYFRLFQYGHLQEEVGTRGSLEQYIKDLTEVFRQCFRVLKPTGLFLLNIDNAKREEGFLNFSAWDCIPILRQIGFKLIGTIIWMDRGRRELYKGNISDHHYEPIFILAKGQGYTFNKFNVPEGDVWEIVNPRKVDIEQGEGDIWDRSGIATFPVELATYIIALGSNEGDTVLDPFAGSGTVMDVAQRLKRNSIAIELNPDFCEMIMKRCFKQEGNEYRYVTEEELERNASKT